MTAGTALSPEPDHWFDEAFTDLLAADDGPLGGRPRSPPATAM